MTTHRYVSPTMKRDEKKVTTDLDRKTKRATTKFDIKKYISEPSNTFRSEKARSPLLIVNLWISKLETV